MPILHSMILSLELNLSGIISYQLNALSKIRIYPYLIAVILQNDPKLYLSIYFSHQFYSLIIFL